VPISNNRPFTDRFGDDFFSRPRITDSMNPIYFTRFFFTCSEAKFLRRRRLAFSEETEEGNPVLSLKQPLKRRRSSRRRRRHFNQCVTKYTSTNTALEAMYLHGISPNLIINRFIIDIADTVCTAGSMKRSSIHPSLSLSHRPTAAAQQLLSAMRAGDIDRQRRARAPSSTGAAARRSAAKTGSHVDG